MATKPKPKPTKSVNRAVNGKIPSQESLLVNTLSTIQNDIRELRSDIKSLDEKLTERIDSNFKWTLGIMATLIVFVFTVMFFLHSDLKSDIAKLETSLKSDILEIKSILKNK